MTSKKKIYLVAAARPNFMKIAPLYHELSKMPWAECKIIHTGQHYDINMSGAFFNDLGLPEPHVNLGVGSGTHSEQTGRVMIEFEKIASKEKPDLTIVVGDVNSTIACTIAAVKLGLKVGHLEAGLRSFDRTMPEEINRIATDSLADILWTPFPDADENLLREGIATEKIQFVGNIMIDSLEMLRKKIESQDTWRQLSLTRGEYGVVTLHRPSNVDDLSKLKSIMLTLQSVSHRLPLIFPIHPRTRNKLIDIAQYSQNTPLSLVDPLNYIPFMNLVFNSKLVVTDSGGLQEETTYLGIPCLTLRENTERPITVTEGTNQLCNIIEIEKKVNQILADYSLKIPCLKFWDGKTSQRVTQSISSLLKI